MNAIAAMFHSGEEIEGPDGLAMMVDMALWNDALDSFEGIIGDEMEPAQPQASAAPSEQDLFERVFPMPEGCMRCGDTYAPTEYSAWSASAFIERFKGWQAAHGIKPAEEQSND